MLRADRGSWAAFRRDALSPRRHEGAGPCRDSARRFFRLDAGGLLS